MTPAERQDPKILNGSRRLRIANGSGVTVTEVNGLVDRFFEARKMMKQMAAACPACAAAPEGGQEGQEGQEGWPADRSAPAAARRSGPVPGGFPRGSTRPRSSCRRG